MSREVPQWPEFDYKYNVFALQTILTHLCKQKMGEKYHERYTKTEINADNFYDHVLGLICDKMHLMKIRHEKFSKHCFFINIENKEWEKKFKENFYKLFIDRQKGNDCNKFSFNKQTRNDVLYAEGFALGFLYMLDFLDKKLSETKQILPTPKELIELFKNFAIFATGSGAEFACDIPNAISTSHKSSIEECRKYKEIWKKAGKINLSFDPDSLMMKYTYSAGFLHEQVAETFLENFFKKVNISNCDDKTMARHLCILVNDIGSRCHIMADSNGRASILMGWFLSLLIGKNQALPVMMYQWFDTNEYFKDGVMMHQWFDTNEYFKEGVMWIRDFLADHDTKMLEEESISTKIAHYENDKLRNNILIDNCLSALLIFDCADLTYPKNQKIIVFDEDLEGYKVIVKFRNSVTRAQEENEYEQQVKDLRVCEEISKSLIKKERGETKEKLFILVQTYNLIFADQIDTTITSTWMRYYNESELATTTEAKSATTHHSPQNIPKIRDTAATKVKIDTEILRT